MEKRANQPSVLAAQWSRSSRGRCAGRGPFAGVGAPGFPSWRGGWPGCTSKVRIPNSSLLFQLPPTRAGPWALVSRHSGALGSPSQGPQVSGENRSWEEQSCGPAQALNIISSSLNSTGTGAGESAGPPSGSQLSKPGAYLDDLLPPRLHLCLCW